jgi:hypothetical protein
MARLPSRGDRAVGPTTLVRADPPPAHSSSSTFPFQMPPPKKPLSAYFCFRRSIGEALKAEFAGQSVAQLAKVAGERWKALTAAERKAYDDEAATEKERFARESAEYGERQPPEAVSAGVGDEDDDDEAQDVLTLPAARIKRLAKIDADVGTVSKDATFALALATELFIGALAVEASDVAKVRAAPRAQAWPQSMPSGRPRAPHAHCPPPPPSPPSL